MPNIYKEIYELIKKGNKEEAKKRLEKLEITSHNEISIQMLQNYIKEQEYLSSLTEEQLDEYNKILETGHRLYKERKNQEALDVYRVGEFLYNTPIFKYYIGKMYYKMHDYNTAFQYLNEYANTGSDKMPKAYLYLYKISQCLKLSDELDMLDQLDRLNGDFHPDFKLRTDEIKKIKSRH